MCIDASDTRFVCLKSPKRIWAFSSIHGDCNRLAALHDAVLERVQPGDRVVYLGNYTGFGNKSCETIDELITFRRILLSIPGVLPQDIVYLRGNQEDLWQKLLQLPFYPHPADVLIWMLDNGLAQTFESYKISAHDGIMACREGVVSLSRWVNRIRSTLRFHPGHDVFSAQFKRAAYTQLHNRYPLLFVNSGIDINKPLAEQEEALWWGGADFLNITQNYDPFEKVFRGYDPLQNGVRINCVTASIDGGCGFGGSLVCSGIAPSGDIIEMLEI